MIFNNATEKNMKKTLKAVALCISVAFSATVMLSGCDFGEKALPKPTFTGVAELTGSTLLTKNGVNCDEFTSDRSLTLAAGESAAASNLDFSASDHYAVNAYLQSPASLEAPIEFGIAQIVKSETEYETVRVAIDFKGLKVKLLACVEGSERVLLEKEIKAESFDDSVAVTVQYNKGIASAWIGDLCLLGEGFSLSGEGETSPYIDFTSDSAATLKFIKLYGNARVKVFNTSDLYEGAENLVDKASWSMSSTNRITFGKGYVKNDGQAFMATLNGLGLKNGEDWYMSFTLKTERAKQQWYGLRLYFSSVNGARDLSLFSLDYALNFDGGANSSPAGYRYSRPTGEDEKIEICRQAGKYYVWLNGEHIISAFDPYPDGSGNVTDMFGFHFEYGTETVSDIFICRANPIEIF